MPPLMFGLNISTSAAPGADPVRDAQAAEALGFDFVSASDHPSGTNPTFETWTMLTWMAAATNASRWLAGCSACLSVPPLWWPRWPSPSTVSPQAG
jgi:alkanesulfonate monooxygenase SsuD/methylene tetrahydromethanopterin reductase-like flavin-dependent oxidoreductase (luciferase family)